MVVGDGMEISCVMMSKRRKASAEVTCFCSRSRRSEAMSSVWHQEPSGFSPCMEIDSSSVRSKERLACPAWLKQEQDELRIIKWEGCQTGASADTVQDNTPSSAMSGKRGLGFQQLLAVMAASLLSSPQLPRTWTASRRGCC